MTTARPIFCGVDALLEDFPSLAGAFRTAEEMARWLTANAAFISTSQAAQETVNTPISTTGAPVEVHRPTGYGRAVVKAAHSPRAGEGAIGLLDLKGAGISTASSPSHGEYSTGLMSLPRALVEYAHQRLVEALFRHAGTAFTTLPVYGILDLGFDCRLPGGQRLPAGMLVRRAHRRPRGGNERPRRGSILQHVSLEIEMLLRHYGITSCSVAFELHNRRDAAQYWFADQPKNDYSPQAVAALAHLLGCREGEVFKAEAVNVQTTREVTFRPSAAQLVDFGHYNVRERFEVAVLSQVCDRPFRWGGLLEVDSEHFAQPLPELAVPFAQWGEAIVDPPTALRFGYEPETRVTQTEQLALRLADQSRAGALSADEVLREIDHIVRQATERWPSA